MIDDKGQGLSRRDLMKYSVPGMLALAGCTGGGGDNSGGNTTGNSSSNNSTGNANQPFFPHTIWGMYGSWEQAYVQGGRFYAEDNGWRFQNSNSQGQGQQQISQIQNFVQQGADGIVVGPVSATAPASAVENAASQDIPVVACNSDIQTPELALSVYVGNEPACQQIGQRVVEYLGNEVGSNNNPEGTVLDIQGDLSQSIGASREQGFRSAIDQHSGIEVLEARANFENSPAQQQTYTQLQSTGGEIDAIFAANGAMAAGATQALQRYGTQPGDIHLSCMDGSPTVIDLFDEGWLQVGYSQPTQYYLPLALHYVNEISNNGMSVLPQAGDEVTTEDLTISGNNHMGTNLWEGQDWAPATVRENNGHLWLQTTGKILTSNNYDDESNWGVIFG